MKIGVCIKQTFDTEADVTLTSEGKINDADVKKIINPYDEVAIEAGLQIKEKVGGEVVCVSVGSSQVKDSIKLALGMGADRGIYINDDGNAKDEYSTSALLAEVMSKEGFDIILGGVRSVDNASNQVISRIAAYLRAPMIAYVVGIDVVSDDMLNIIHEIEDGQEIIEVGTPVVLGVQKGLNEPRVVSTKGLLKAKKKPIEEFSASELSQRENKLTTEKYIVPPKKEAGKVIEGDAKDTVRLLIDYLKNDVGVI